MIKPSRERTFKSFTINVLIVFLAFIFSFDSYALLDKNKNKKKKNQKNDEVKICGVDGKIVTVASEDLADPIKIATFLINDYTVFNTLDEAINSKLSISKPEKNLTTSKGTPFPSFSKCEKTFFRVATVPQKVDEIISASGWLSGYERGLTGSGLPPSADINERIIQYVGVKGGYNGEVHFPKNSTIIGVLEDPIRTLSVGFHTGWTNDSNKYMRMDEIEIGECADAPECKTIKAYDSTKVFTDDNEKRLENGQPTREPRYSTEGEWAIESKIPNSCVVATYRIVRQKVDKVIYSGSY